MRGVAFTFAGAVIVAASACRRPTAKKTTEEPAKVVAFSTSDHVSIADAAIDAPSTAPTQPLPTPPTVACTPDPRLRWAVGRSAGTNAFACSSLKTADVPLTLTVAPGTILEMPLDAEEHDEQYGWYVLETATAVRFVTKDLPKLAWIDPKTTSFKWHVRGDEGEAFAFSIAAKVDFPEGEGCVTAPVVIVVSDTPETRKTQATWVADHDGKPDKAFGPRLPQGSDPTPPSDTPDTECPPANVPEMRDLDGDGLADAIFSRYGDGTRNQTKVLLRRGDTYASLGNTAGSPAYAVDGTMFVVDVDGPNMGCECNSHVTVSQFYKSGLGRVLDVETRAHGEHQPTPECNGTGMSVDYDDAGHLIGVTDDLSGPNTEDSIWRWNGKAFALTYAPPK